MVDEGDDFLNVPLQAVGNVDDDAGINGFAEDCLFLGFACGEVVPCGFQQGVLLFSTLHAELGLFFIKEVQFGLVGADDVLELEVPVVAFLMDL